MFRFDGCRRLATAVVKGPAGAGALILLLAAESASAWFPTDALHGFPDPVTLNLRVHRWQLTGGGNIVPFNGTSQYLNLGNDPLLNVSAHDFTVAVWVQFNSLASPDPNCSEPRCGEMSLVDKMLSHPVADSDGWRLYKTADHRFRFCLGGESGGCSAGNGTSVESDTGVAAGEWYHVAVRKTDGTLSLFLNGRAYTTIGLGSFTDSGQADLLIGRNEAEGAFLNGTIDTVGLYPGALRGNQIRKLYEQARRGHQDQFPQTADSSAEAQTSSADAAVDASNAPALLQTAASAGSTGQLFISTSPGRADPTPLDGLPVAGPIYIFAIPSADVRQVKFWLDDASPTTPTGTPTTIEYVAPFDFMGTNPTGTGLPFDTGGLAKGVHTISARITMSDGGTLPVVTGTFAIQ